MAYTNPSAGSFLTRAGNYNVAPQRLDEEVTMTRFIDASVDNLNSAAFYKIFSVPAGFQLLDAFVTCVTAEGAIETIDIVDDDSATTIFVNNASLEVANVITGTNARKYYAAAGFIVIRPDADITAAKFYVTIRGQVLNTGM